VDNAESPDAGSGRVAQLGGAATGMGPELSTPGAAADEVHAGVSGIEACDRLAESILSRLPMGRSGAVFLADAGHGEARTELLAELLPVLARRAESEVLAVDADLQRGQLTARLGVWGTRGVAHVLLRACAWQEAVRQTCLAGVRLLPSVEFDDPEGRLLRPYRWERLFAELRRRFRLIVVDGASVVGPRPSPAASYCDASYLLVCLGRTAYRQAADAAAALRRQGARVEGCIAVGVDGAGGAR